ncbi:hypothetical protein HYH03_000253 [Edaphochlamys debaryana]|uniref:Uncharacterized protein n=1 Tax=Edaphochlamys debaryana TaxID=47281 RepID=A0A835YFH4_9CHLO|nr:hypothetical protein HYH03_000253 [Edaphochlamys debaryana]|eukprot:KAG2501753.1 hypothetical protein HYH03_000253 [Edaphochlamys debaryana]
MLTMRAYSSRPCGADVHTRTVPAPWTSTSRIPLARHPFPEPGTSGRVACSLSPAPLPPHARLLRTATASALPWSASAARAGASFPSGSGSLLSLSTKAAATRASSLSQAATSALHVSPGAASRPSVAVSAGPDGAGPGPNSAPQPFDDGPSSRAASGTNPNPTSSNPSSESGGSSSGRPAGGAPLWGKGASQDPRGLPPPIVISPVALRVVVIGWMGSQKRYLNKYGALWARSGDHEVLMVRPSILQTLVRWRGVVVAGRDIDRVARLHRENPAMPTVYHIFSTGGFIHAGTMWRWMDEVEDVAQRRDLLEEVRGIILDSAPASVNAEMASKAIVSAVTGTPAEELEHGMPGLQGALLSGTRAFLERYLQSKGVQLRTEEVYDAWYNLAPSCPQLYLYSDGDPLVPASDVERYMQVQEGRGVEVSSYKWPDSGHVEHYRRYPHEYAYQISAFLAKALKDW